MDIEARKYHIIQELFSVEEESIIAGLERVLKLEKQQQELSNKDKQELDSRITKYKNAPNNVLDWEDVKNDW